jgi:tetratricopeptide (TPR) repeat protein
VAALPLFFGVISVFVGPYGDDALIAAAAASGRPAECAHNQRRGLSRGPSVWQLARVPNLQPYCDLVARAHAQLQASPEKAKESAAKAEAMLAGYAAPEVILGRAELLLGKPDEAAKHFARAETIDPRSLEDPATMHDMAKSLMRTGKRGEALVVYRALVPRAALLPDNGQRVAVLLEAAHVSMAEAAARPMRPAAPAAPSAAPVETRESLLAEAIAYLREARQVPNTHLTGDVILSLALTLDRADRLTQADALLIEVARTGATARPGTPEYLVEADDKLLIDALALSSTDPKAARGKLEAYLASGSGQGAWNEAAQKRMNKIALPAQRPRKKK